MAQSSTASLVILTESCMHFFTQKQTAHRGSINNSSKSYHHRTASSEICYFANEQKTTANKLLRQFQISPTLLVCSVRLFDVFYTSEMHLDLLFYTIYLRRATLDLHIFLLSHFCALMMDEG